MSSPEHDALPAEETAALAVAGALWAAEPEPKPDGRAALLQALAGEPVEEPAAPGADDEPAPGPDAELEVRLHCTYCHDRLELGASVYCGQCLAPHHADCVADHGACAAPGCTGTRFVRAEPATRPRRLRTAALVAAGLIGLATAAAALIPGGGDAPAPAPAPAQATEAPTPAPRPRPAREDGRLQVLYVEGSPRWEYRYLKEILIHEPALALQLVLHDLDPDLPPEAPTPGSVVFDRVPADLSAYDVVILGDVDPADLSSSWLASLRREVEDYGLGLIVASGSKYPRSAAFEALAPLLPVELGPAPASGHWSLRLTGAGGQVPALRLGATYTENARIWRDLPRIAWHAGAVGPTPGSEVWVEVQGREGNPAAPVLAARQAGSGQVVWFGFEEVWRWRAEVGDEYVARCFLTLLERVRPPASRWAVEVEAEREAEQKVQLEAASALLERAQDALHRGYAGQAETFLDEARRDHGLAVQGPLAARERALRDELTLARAAQPWLEAQVTAEDVAALEDLAARLAGLPSDHAYRAGVEERLARAQALRHGIQRDPGLSEVDAALARKVRGRLEALQGGGAEFPDASACNAARDAFEEARTDPSYSPTDLDQIRLAVAVVEQQHDYLRRAQRIVDEERVEDYASTLPRLALLAEWLPEGALQDRAAGLFSALRVEFVGVLDQQEAQGLQCLEGAWSLDVDGRRAAVQAREHFARVRSAPGRTRAQIERIKAAVADGERRARFLYNVEKVYTQNREDLFEDVRFQLALLQTWLPPGHQRTKAIELLRLIEERWAKILRFRRGEK